MSLLTNLVIVLATFLTMEAIAWFAHKHVMHGFMWWFHKDHHVHEPGFFEKNDAFFLIFAVPSAYCFITGTLNGDFRVWIGLGILLYGICYLIVHDIFIHQRFKWLRRTDNAYFKAIRKAHLLHHKHLGPEDGECFGMLWAPYRLFKEALKTNSSLGSLPFDFPQPNIGHSGAPHVNNRPSPPKTGVKAVDFSVPLPRPGSQSKPDPDSENQSKGTR
mgnify:CR=1 FL=1|jgi:beta-carotene 3-hydroxylase